MNLTGPQSCVLEFILRYRTERQMPPTRAEISRAMGWRSPNAAQEVLEALDRKGCIKLMPNIARGIFVMSAE